MRQTSPQPARHPSAKATKLAHLIFHRPDLDRAETFLRDFGLTAVERSQERILARAADESPYCYRVHRAHEERFVGLGLLVGARAELEALSKLPGASPISEVTMPDGEQVVLPPRQCRSAARDGTAAGTRTRPCRPRLRRLPEDRRLVHRALRTDPQRRAAPAGRLPPCRLPAAGPRRHPGRPPQHRRGPGPVARVQPQRLRGHRRRCRGRRRRRPGAARPGIPPRLGRLADFVQWAPEVPVSMVRPKVSLRTARLAWHYLRHTPDVSVGELRSMARLISASRTR